LTFYFSRQTSIAALPFQNMIGDLEQDYFADGTVEDVTSALSRLNIKVREGRDEGRGEGDSVARRTLPARARSMTHVVASNHQHFGRI
jgi:TolB-like protein